ncbi:hypothetical protein ACFLZZ_02545 [Nanoarchaeota archaeon]
MKKDMSLTDKIEVKPYFETDIGRLNIRDENGKIVEGIVSKLFMSAFSKVLKANNLDPRGEDYHKLAKSCFGDYSTLLKLTEKEKKKCFDYYLND